MLGVLSTLLLPAITAASQWVARVNTALATHTTSLAVSAEAQADIKDRLVRIEGKLDKDLSRGK